MGNISGTNLAAAIVPFTTEDTYPTHYSEYGKGGWHSVATKEDLDNIPEGRRSEGMAVYVVSDKTLYILHGSVWDKFNISKDDVDGLQDLLDTLKSSINEEMEDHENAERAYHNEVVRVVNEAKAYMNDCLKMNNAICGYDGENGIPIFDESKTYTLNELVAIKQDGYYTIYRCIVASHTGAFSEADFVGTNMYQEYNRIFAGGAEEQVVISVFRDGAPLSGKVVTLTNITQNISLQATTGDDGIAVFGTLVPYGETYTVTAEAEAGCNVMPSRTFVANTPNRGVKLEFITSQQVEAYDIPVVTVYAYERQQIQYDNTTVEDALAGKQCTLLIDGEVVETVLFENRVATFTTQIPTRSPYKIVLPNLEDKNLRIRSQEIDVVAIGGGFRNMSADYFMLHPYAGVVAISEAGEVFSLTALQAKLDKMDEDGATEQDKQNFKDSILYIGISNEATQPADATGIANNTGGLEASAATSDGKNNHVYSTTPKNCSFLFHVRQVNGGTYKALKWQESNVNVQNMPFVSNSAASFLKDMDGAGRTAQMVQSGMSFPAMEWVTQEVGDIQSPFDSSETLPAFMPSAGQLYQLQLYKNDINELTRVILGKEQDYNFSLFSGYWWSASQYSATYALYLYSGSMANNGKSSTNVYAVRFYEFA
ncbi:MAG: carboxypeptidase-like regulatory domain-containing protein [Paludibacteraceae bacterium]